MPGHEPKGQHYVHRAYLEGFIDPATMNGNGGSLWLYLPNKRPMPQKPERLAKRNYYYCYEKEQRKQFVAEHTLQKLEDVSLPVLNSLRQRSFALSGQDRLTFAGYIALSFTRVPTFERTTNLLASFVAAKQLEAASRDIETLEEAARLHREETGENKTAEQVRADLTGGSVVATPPTRAWSLEQMIAMTMHLQKVIVEMNWTFLIAPAGDPGFLTSDNPVALFDPAVGRHQRAAFASTKHAYFTFPICRDICLLAQHVPGPPTAEVSPREVRSINSRAISRSDTQVYAPFKSEKIQAILDKASRMKPSGKSRVLFRKGRVVIEQPDGSAKAAFEL